MGSSPLTRGKRDGRPECLRARRLIPAHAGKTAPTLTTLRRRRAHPRSRGENLCGSAARGPLRGSSPLTRGKPLDAPPDRPVAGLIPAHAGKTHQQTRQPHTTPAHPRSRGENGNATVVLLGDLGSSPLTRGKLQAVVGMLAPMRLIPAHAGKTVGERVTADVCEAHPRSRGENRIYTEGRTIPGGSSPLTRGKLGLANQGGPALRLIPAHAGKTRCVRPPPVLAEAHPRSRGENILSVLGGSISPGSSPLTRGKPRRVAYLAMALRLIPAHAGKTLAPVG